MSLWLVVRPTKRSPMGKRSWGFGVAFGYWPCLRAPYVRGIFLFWRLEIWYGEPGYKPLEGSVFSLSRRSATDP